MSKKLDNIPYCDPVTGTCTPDTPAADSGKLQDIPYCDPVTGSCTPGAGPESAQQPAATDEEDGEADDAEASSQEVIYIGDPMCSWCWGMEPGLRTLHKAAAEAGLPYTILVGGLRPGGGEAWDDAMRQFLLHHWEEVWTRTGQPFSYELLDDKERSFDYDTEPPCRAVVIAREMLLEREDEESALHDFFAGIQHHFYADNADPGQVDFYREICAQTGLDFAVFSERFASEEARQATYAEFNMVREWGVSGFPTVVLRKGRELHLITSGYATGKALVHAMKDLMAA